MYIACKAAADFFNLVNFVFARLIKQDINDVLETNIGLSVNIYQVEWKLALDQGWKNYDCQCSVNLMSCAGTYIGLNQLFWNLEPIMEPVAVAMDSDVATRGPWGVECHPWQRKICQKSGKRGKNQGKSGKKRKKSGRKGKNQEVSFTLPLLTDRAGYATGRGACKQIVVFFLVHFDWSSCTPKCVRKIWLYQSRISINSCQLKLTEETFTWDYELGK